MRILFILPAIMLVLSIASHFAMPAIDKWAKSLQYGQTIHFYSQEAYDHCNKLRHEVKMLGSNHWICHNPSEVNP